MVLGMVLGIASIAGCAAQPATTADQSSIPAVERPTTLEGVLRNIKFALNRGLFLREDFYQGAVLHRYFGGSLTLKSSLASGVDGSVSGFGDMVEPLVVSGHAIPGMSFSFLRVSGPDGITAVIDVSTPGKTTVDLGIVQGIFGRGWRPRGNAEIVYSTSDGARSWRAVFTFKSNAELSLAHISTKGKH
jgi:hypothetical protein